VCASTYVNANRRKFFGKTFRRHPVLTAGRRTPESLHRHVPDLWLFAATWQLQTTPQSKERKLAAPRNALNLITTGK
jgi:hypothetical protein